MGGLVCGRRAYTRPAKAKTLAQEHGIAIGTVTRAVDVLREEGLVRTIPGRGVWVVDRSA